MNQLAVAAGKARAFPASRLAVSLLFLMNGYVVGSWAPKIPEFAARLGLSESGLGLVIVAFGVGSLVTMPIVGWLVARHGSHPVLRWQAVICCFTLLMITVAPNIPMATVAAFVLGAFVGGMDVAMNANAVSVEKSMGRAIMSSCHGFWSLGGLIGATTGGYLLALIGTLNHVLLVTAVCLALVAIAWPKVMEDHTPAADGAREKVRFPSSPLPWIVGIMALFSMVPEGAVLDWGALYLRDELGATLTQSGFAFGAFSATMAVMRFAGDLVRDRFGAVTTLRACTVAAIIGMVIAGFATSPVMAIIGFAICGIGISNMVPIAFSAAGNLPGMAAGVGLSVATSLGYAGILFAPSSIGFIAEYTGFAVIFKSLPVLFLVVLALSALARYADQPAK